MIIVWTIPKITTLVLVTMVTVLSFLNSLEPGPKKNKWFLVAGLNAAQLFLLLWLWAEGG